MTVKRKIIIAVVVVAVVAGAAVLTRAWFYAADKVAQPDSYREYITKTVSEKMHRSIAYDKSTASLTLRNGLTFNFTHLVISEKDGASDFLRVDEALVRINILPLLRNRLVFGELVLDRPRVALKRDSSGVLNIADLLIRKEDKKAPRIRKVIIKKGAVTFVDQAADPAGLVTSLENLDGRINALFWMNRYRFHITSSILENNNRASVELSGLFSPVSAGKPVYESKLRASVHLKDADLKHYNAYLKTYTPIEQVSGKLKLDITYTGRFSDFKSKGTVTLRNASLYYPGVFNGYVRPRIAEANFSLKRDKKSLSVDVGRLTVDKFNAKGSFEMDDLYKKDPLLEASAITTAFQLKDVTSYVPWGIIHKGVGDFIQEHIKDGKFRLIEGKLKGRLSQIANINHQEGVDVLSITAEVDKGVFEVVPSAPFFNDIKGILELKRRQFSIKNIRAYFGKSPCTVEGNISDFARPGPNIYTAYMKVQPVRDDVVWLLGEKTFNDMDFRGTSLLTLSGKGPDTGFRIRADWNLTDVAYAFPGVLEKPRSRKNQFTADLVIDDQAVDFQSFKHVMPPVNVTGNMRLRYEGDSPASFSIQSGTFDIREAAPLLPLLQKFDPTGAAQIAVTGQGNLNEPSSLQWKGNIALKNISLDVSDKFSRMQGLTGSVSFKNRSMQTSLFRTQIGRSKIQGNFWIEDFSDSRVFCRVNSEALKASDLGLKSAKGDVTLRDVKGQLSFEDELIHVERLQFGAGTSTFILSGDITEFDLPKVTLELSSMYVHSEDLSRLMALSYPSKDQKAKSTVDLNAVFLLDGGTFGDAPFQKLYAVMKLKNDILDVDELEVGIFDGKFKAKGRVVLPAAGPNRYDANITVDKISLDKLQQYLELGDRTVTGDLSLSANISMSGANAGELKQSAMGTVKVRAEKGVLKKFAVLSKIFSLLNIVQLAKLKLPDMATGGMPYSEITFHATFKGGVISSEDFFIDSNAMQISGTGSIDFVRKKLDFVAGVHPLQSLDLIASKIPIAGWIITDERGKLITAHFKVDGTWDDPKVSTITAKSIGKGTLDIFRRIFQLPEKLVTDTGEVILGH